MTVLEQLNRPELYLICGGIILFIAAVCVVMMVRAWKAGIRLGMDPARMKRTIVASATFSVLPSVGILLGVLALSGSLGTPWPWLRLSVIGALHYETQVAEAAAEQMKIHLGADQMTLEAFATIALVMSACIMSGPVLAAVFTPRYTKKLQGQGNAPSKAKGGFGDQAMVAMFIGMVSAYIGSYIGGFVSGEGRFAFRGSWLPLAVVLVSAAVMAVLTWLSEKKKMQWLDNFSIAVSMLCGMAAAALLG